MTLEQQAQQDALLAAVRATKFDYSKPVAHPEPLLSFWSEGKRYPVGGKGMIGGIIGPEKAGKSFIVSKLAESHLTAGSERLNFELKLSGNMMFLDTEQSAFFYDATQRRIHNQAGVKMNVDKYSAYHLRRWSPTERMSAIERLVYETQNLECVIIDGAIDLLDDYNDLKQSDAVMSALMRWSYDLNIMLLGILHVNKGDGKIRGHLGSSWKNKADFLLRVEQPKRNEYEISNPTGRFVTFPTMTFSRDEWSENGDAIYENGKIKSNFV
jgi:hypothetical protein